MSLFLLWLIIGLLLQQVAAAIEPARSTRSFYSMRLSDVRVTMTTDAYLRIKVGVLVTVILAIFLGVALVATAGSHPPYGYAYSAADVLTSPRMATAVFGFLVGILLGNLLTRIWRGKDYAFQLKDKTEVILILILFLLGIGGEEYLRSAAQRISKVSLGTTTEISFSGATPRASRVSAEQPGGAFRNTAGDSGGSTGLQKLYDIASDDNAPNVTRDVDFINILALYEEDKTIAGHRPWLLAETILSPVGSCLSRISLLNGDDVFIDQQLLLLSRAMQALAMPSSTTYDDVRETMGEMLTKLRAYLDVSRIAENSYIKTRVHGDAIHDKRYSCDNIKALTADQQTLALQDSSLESFILSSRTYPYATMAHASVLVALRRYEAAAITMDAWIIEHAQAKTPAEKWYLLRARLTQSQFVNEWIRERGNAASSWLRHYHISNLNEIAASLQSFNALSQLAKTNATYQTTPGVFATFHTSDAGSCAYPRIPGQDKTKPDREPTPEEQERLRTINDTWLSVQRDYIDQALKHPLDKVRHAIIIWNQMSAVMKQNLRCTKVSPLVTRAKYIETFVRTEINMIEQSSAVTSSDQTRNRIRDAEQLLALAFQLIDEPVRAAISEKGKGPIRQRISPDPTLEIYETLLATRSQIKDFSEREVTP